MPDRDLTPYDLAERLAQGLPVTDQGKLEIACELVWVRSLVEATTKFLDKGGADSSALASIKLIAARIDPEDT